MTPETDWHDVLRWWGARRCGRCGSTELDKACEGWTLWREP